MITQLNGRLIEKNPTSLVIDCGGVGYEVKISLNTFGTIGSEESIKIYTKFVVREDAQLLYGFLTAEEKSSFKSLIKVNGIGAKVALSILSGVSIEQFLNAINLQDVSLLIKIPGIGRKTAERLIVELKDKQFLNLQKTTEHGKNLTDIMDALEALGYSKADIQKVIKDLNDDISVNDGIKQALQWLSN